VRNRTPERAGRLRGWGVGTLVAVNALLVGAAVWSFGGSSSEEVSVVRVVPDAGPARPVPAMTSWRPIATGVAGEAVPMGIYLTDDAPEAAAVRAAERFRAAGWTPLPAPASRDAGRHVLAFRSGGAVCWVVIEPDPRTGATRCALAGL
jgi:hypothetical protein